MQELNVGDKVEDDSLIILDEDRLCYSVKSFSNGGIGVRTISKALLAEWVAVYKQTPNAPSQTVRKLLVGKSEIDRFEYGYAGTLAKMAKMILGQIPIIHSNAEDIRQNEFYNWMLQVEKKAPKTAQDTARTYLPSISDDARPPTTNIWHGLREYLYNEKPGKRLYAIDNLAELETMYSGINRIFQQDSKPEELDPQRFIECKKWAYNSQNHNSVRAAWAMYKRFLQWREEHKKPTQAILSTNIDYLSIALKLFTQIRYEADWQGKSLNEDHLSIYTMHDVKPEELAEYSLDDFYTNFLMKIWAFRNGGSRRYGPLEDTEKLAYRDFIVEMKSEFKSFDAYFPPDKKCPNGMGVGVLTELLMRFWPNSCCSYNDSLIYDALKVIGMAQGDFIWPSKPSIYQDFMGKCATILLQMEQMKLPRRPNPDNDEPPDYTTVNEFLWFVHDYKDLIQEEVMKKQLKTINSREKLKKGNKNLSDAFHKDDLLKRLAAALRTKPFAILAGHSGTGKSQLVRRLAYMTCNNELLIKEGEDKTAPGNYCMVQVKPNWHDSTDLLGYYSEMGGRHFVTTPFVQFICKAYAYPDTPFFVCLDEMNLAPVEQYFAEYLSAIESMEEKDDNWVTDPLVEVDKTGEIDTDGTEKLDAEIAEQIMKGAASFEALKWIQKHGVTIPRNLFVIGTVNMDETTCQFSRKVLDRAMTLLMNEVNFGKMATIKKPSDEELLNDEGLNFFLKRNVHGVINKIESDLLNGINEPLANTAFMVAYRFANEYALYEAALAKLENINLENLENDEEKIKFAQKALDHVVLMKLLPRIHGERTTVQRIFKGYTKGEQKVLGLKDKLPKDGLSAKMMDAILARNDEYLTFWP